MVNEHNTLGEPPPHLALGPRLTAELRRRVKELESRHPGALTSFDKRELSRLRELLQLAKQGGDHHD
jgi:hypothetical protein